MAQTITNGQLDRDGFTIIPTGSTTWADLGSSPFGNWENWTSWNPTPNNIEVSETIDAGTSAYRVPLIWTETLGDFSVTVDISDTGTFTGEQTTLTFATDDVGKTFPKGRYYRWNITIAPNAQSPIPYLQYFTELNSSQYDIYKEDVAVPALPTDSLGFRLVSNPFGAVTHIQATTLQGDDYVDNGYVYTFDALDPFVRTSNTELITNVNNLVFLDNNDIAGAAPYNRHNQSAVFIEDEYAEIEILNTDSRIMDNDTWTIEFWFRSSDWDYLEGEANIKYIFYGDATPDVGGSGSGDISIGLIRPDDDQENIYLRWQINTTPTGSLTRSHTNPIVPNTWYHFSISAEGLNVESYLNGGDGIAPTLPNPLGTPEVIRIGTGVLGSAFSEHFEGVISEFRISNTVRYPEPINIETVFSPFVSDANTTLLLHFDDSVEDDNLVRTGTEDYFYRQNGGSAVVESKNPLALKVVDYQGEPWDGAVDLHLRGLPKIAKLGNRLIIKFEE